MASPSSPSDRSTWAPRSRLPMSPNSTGSGFESTTTGLETVRASLRARALRADGSTASFAVRQRDTSITVNGGLVTTLPSTSARRARYILLELKTNGDELEALPGTTATEGALTLLFSSQYARVDLRGPSELGPAEDPWGCCTGCDQTASECGDLKRITGPDPEDYRCTSRHCILTYDCSFETETTSVGTVCKRVNCQVSCRESTACC